MEDYSSSGHDNYHSPEYNHSRGRISSEDGDKWHSSAGYNPLYDNGFGDERAGGDANSSVSISQNSKPVSNTEDKSNKYFLLLRLIYLVRGL